jgi:hypothetical protein
MLKHPLALDTLVDVCWVHTAHSPVLHIDRSCTGLERTAPANVTTEPQTTIAAAIDRRHPEDTTFRPCRACALETFTVAVLGTDRRKRSGTYLASFSSQPSRMVDERRFVDATVSDTGRERLERIASATGLSLATSSVGPVLFGHVTRSGVEFLQANFRTVVLDTLKPPAVDTVAVFWTLLRDGGIDGDRLECWATAVAITTAPKGTSC